MKRFIILFSIMCLVFVGTNASAENKVRAFTTLTGGGTGALDKISVADLTDGDAGLVFTISGTTVTMYFYVYDADGTSAEDSPAVIRPDDYSTGGNWRLSNFYSGGLTMLPAADPMFEFNDSDAAGADEADNEASRLLANQSTTTEDAEVSDVALTFMDAGTRESFMRWDGSAWQLFLGPQTDGWAGGDVAGYEQLTIDFDTATDAEIAITSASSATRFDIQIATTVVDALETSGGIELGHASDTTIARSGAGAATLEGVAILTNDMIDASAELYAIMDDETGSGGGSPLLVFNYNPTLTGFALGADADFGDYDIHSVDGLYGVDDQVYLDLGTDGKAILASDTTVEFLASDEDLTIADGGTNLITIGTNTGVTEINTTLQFVTTGDIMGGINISEKTDATYTIGTDDAHEAYGTLFVNGDNDAIDFTLPSAVAGMSVCIYQDNGVTGAITIQPNTGDYLIIDGVRGTAATDYSSTGGATDRICVVAISADDWIVTSETGTWSE